MDWSEYRIIARADQKFFPYGNSYISYSHTPPKCRCKAVFFVLYHEIVSMFDTYYKETTAICKFVLKIITTSFYHVADIRKNHGVSKSIIVCQNSFEIECIL